MAKDRITYPLSVLDDLTAPPRDPPMSGSELLAPIPETDPVMPEIRAFQTSRGMRSRLSLLRRTTTLELESIKQAYLDAGYAWFGEGEFNLNLFGIRGESSDPGEFNDLIGVAYVDADGAQQLRIWPATTDPGRPLLLRPINVAGTAILVPGQYPGAYQIGNHRGYEALVQRGPVRVWRDRNRDAQLDWGDDAGIEGYYGINIHRARPKGDTPDVGSYSAGCQVFQSARDFDDMMAIARSAARRWGPRITYTLFTADQIPVDLR